ncbi:MAG: hypothetical protein VYD60_10085, partial [Pseudomonadota bacterium]|nr:hypothetical protein [Pseudomonadota bacterium]
SFSSLLSSSCQFSRAIITSIGSTLVVPLSEDIVQGYDRQYTYYGKIHRAPPAPQKQRFSSVLTSKTP